MKERLYFQLVPSCLRLQSQPLWNVLDLKLCPVHPTLESRLEPRVTWELQKELLSSVEWVKAICILMLMQRVTSALGVLVGSQRHWQGWEPFKLNPSRNPLSCCFTSWAVICAHTVVWVHNVPALSRLSLSWRAEAGEFSALESASAQQQHPPS